MKTTQPFNSDIHSLIMAILCSQNMQLPFTISIVKLCIKRLYVCLLYIHSGHQVMLVQVKLCYVTSRYITLHYVGFGCGRLGYIGSDYIMLGYVQFVYVTLVEVRLGYTINYFVLHFLFVVIIYSFIYLHCLAIPYIHSLVIHNCK